MEMHPQPALGHGLHDLFAGKPGHVAFAPQMRSAASGGMVLTCSFRAASPDQSGQRQIGKEGLSAKVCLKTSGRRPKCAEPFAGQPLNISVIGISPVS